MHPWNIKQLHEALMRDLAACNTESERINCRAIGGREIVEKAYAFDQMRKLTPAEIAIAEQYGYRA